MLIFKICSRLHQRCQVCNFNMFLLLDYEQCLSWLVFGNSLRKQCLDTVLGNSVSKQCLETMLGNNVWK